MCGLGRPGRLRSLRSFNSPVRVGKASDYSNRAAANQLLPSSLLIVLFRLLIPIDGLRFGLGNPHPLSGNMPSIPSLGCRQVKNGRLFLTTTEVPPSSDWCSKQEIQAVAATIQRLFRRQQNRNQSINELSNYFFCLGIVSRNW